jgi:outer membrane protein assembly factor BamD (BamD/ComL family)
MAMKINKIVLTVVLFILLIFNYGFTQDDGQIYSMAIREAKSGNIDFAFMHFRSLLRNYPDSKYAHDGLFAVGEYYFITADYKNAAEAWSNFINDYPDSKGLPFALMYLLRIAEIRRDAPLLEKLKNKIISLKQLTFLFQESKGYTYKSPLRKKYRMIYYIGRVEFYVEDELFEKISY